MPDEEKLLVLPESHHAAFGAYALKKLQEQSSLNLACLPAHYVLGLTAEAFRTLVTEVPPKQAEAIVGLSFPGNSILEYVATYSKQSAKYLDMVAATVDALSRDPQGAVRQFNKHVLKDITDNLARFSHGADQDDAAYTKTAALLTKLFHVAKKAQNIDRFVDAITITKGDYQLEGPFFTLLQTAVERNDASLVMALLDGLPAAATVKLLDREMEIAADAKITGAQPIRNSHVTLMHNSGGVHVKDSFFENSREPSNVYTPVSLTAGYPPLRIQMSEKLRAAKAELGMQTPEVRAI